MNTSDLLNGWRKKVDIRVAKPELERLFIEFTRKCNLNCKHCGSPSEVCGHGEELTATEWIELVLKPIAEEFAFGNFKHVIFTGGEPFARLNDLLEVLTFMSQHPFFQSTVIQNNGVALSRDPSLFLKLRKLGVSGLGFSIDGIGSTHDSFRGKAGSFDMAVEAAKRSVNEGFMTTVGCVMTTSNFAEMKEMYSFVRDQIGAQVMRFIPLDVQGRTGPESEYLLGPDQIKQAIDTVSLLYGEVCEAWDSGKRPTVIEFGCMDWLGREIEGRCQPKINCCIAGINTLGVMHDGLIGACSNISREFSQGNVRTDNIHQVWEEKFQPFRVFDWKKTGECAGCEEWEYCRGGAMHRHSADGSRTMRCAYKVLEGLDVSAKKGGE